jgi:hypothetical protein
LIVLLALLSAQARASENVKLIGYIGQKNCIPSILEQLPALTEGADRTSVDIREIDGSLVVDVHMAPDGQIATFRFIGWLESYKSEGGDGTLYCQAREATLPSGL